MLCAAQMAKTVRVVRMHFRKHYPLRGFFLLMRQLSVPGGGKQRHQLQPPPDPRGVPAITHSSSWPAWPPTLWSLGCSDQDPGQKKGVGENE